MVGFLGNLIKVLVEHNRIRAREVEARLHDAKRRSYQEFVSVWMTLLRKGVRAGRGAMPSRQDIEKLNSCKTDLMMWASPAVIKAWNALEEASESGGPPAQTMLALEDAIRAMRSDLGHDDSVLPRGELINLLMTPESKSEIRELLDS